MYEDMMKDVQNKMKPVTDMAEINKSTAEKLIALQTAYVTDLFNSGLAQMKALSEIKEPKAAIELQVKYFKDLEAKLTNVTEQEIATLTAAKEQLTDIVEKGMSEMADVPAMAEVTKFMQTAQEKMTEVPAMAEMTKFMQTAQEKMTEVPAVAEMTKLMQTAQEQMTEAAKAFTPEAAVKAFTPEAAKSTPADSAPVATVAKAAPKAAARKNAH